MLEPFRHCPARSSAVDLSNGCDTRIVDGSFSRKPNWYASSNAAVPISEVVGGIHEQPAVARRFGRRQDHRRARRGAQGIEAGGKHRLEACADGQWHIEGADTGPLPIVEATSGLNERQRVPAGCLHQYAQGLGAELHTFRREELGRIDRPQTAQLKLRQPAQKMVVVLPVPCREEHPDMVRTDAPSGEEHRELRARVEPLQIVDHDHAGAICGGQSQQSQGAGGDRQLVPAPFSATQGQGGRQSGPLDGG